MQSADPVTGQAVCRDAAARAAGCAPFNPFGFDSVSREAADYITAGGIKDTYDAKIQQDVVAANITGPVFDLPAGSVMIAAGAEYRKEESEEIYSLETQAGNTMGNALSNTNGEYNVREAYIETRRAADHRRAVRALVGIRSGLSHGRLLDGRLGQQLESRHDLGTDRRHPLPRGVLRCDPRAEHRRAVLPVPTRPSRLCRIRARRPQPGGPGRRLLPFDPRDRAAARHDWRLRVHAQRRAEHGRSEPQQPGRARGGGEDLDRRRRVDAAGLPQLHDVDRLFPDRDRGCDPAGSAQLHSRHLRELAGHGPAVQPHHARSRWVRRGRARLARCSRSTRCR